MGVFRPDLFDGRRVLVTGGGSGIGLAIAKAFAAHGAETLLLSRNEERLAAACRQIARARYLAGDVRDAERMTQLAAETGPLDVLVNAAAGNFPALFAGMSPNAWETVVDIVLKGTANTTRAFGTPMRAQGGVVLNILAGYAWTGAPGVSHSGAAKAGVLNLTRSLAVEWAPKVRVNAVSPGAIGGTEGMKRLGESMGLGKHLIAETPLARLGAVDDIANACLFLASDAADYVTGACLVVDGGRDAVGPFFPMYRALGAGAEP